MPEGDPELAQLWLSEMGAHVPEWADGGTLAPREKRFGLDLPAAERAARNGARLDGEPSRAWQHNAWGRARSDPTGRA
jgi:hypothetical protein